MNHNVWWFAKWQSTQETKDSRWALVIMDGRWRNTKWEKWHGTNTKIILYGPTMIRIVGVQKKKSSSFSLNINNQHHQHYHQSNNKKEDGQLEIRFDIIHSMAWCVSWCKRCALGHIYLNWCSDLTTKSIGLSMLSTDFIYFWTSLVDCYVHNYVAVL